MASLISVFVVLLGSLLCCGRVSYIGSRAINSVEALPLRGQLRQVRVQQLPFFDHHPTSSELADTKKAKREEGMSLLAKRLVGLLRCSGWGPSCWSGYDEPKLRSNHPSQRSPNVVHYVPSSRLVSVETTAREPKFQPFFTLTSGKYSLQTAL